MSVSVRRVLSDAQVQLQDTGGVRWPAPELAGYLDEALTQLVAARPDLFTHERALALDAGVEQNLPDDCLTLIDIPRNLSSAARPIHQCERRALALVAPDWYRRRQSAEIRHFIYDPRAPRRFEVFPPAIDGTQVQALVVTAPAGIPIPPAATAASASGEIDLPITFQSPLLDFVLHRAWAKDAEYAGNAQLSAAYLELWSRAINTQAQSTTTVRPRVANSAT